MTASSPQPSQDRDAFLELHLPGASAASAALRTKIRDLNSTRARDLVTVVLIRGESGSGKTHLADVMAAHRVWAKERDSAGAGASDAPLYAFHQGYQQLHVPSFPDTLIESELFGHRKGAFTGAVENRDGLLGGEEGTEFDDILLDEIGDASLPMQAKLLRVIETGQFRPVGGKPDEVFTLKARLLLATNRDLEKLVSEGKFREDLYWRIRQFTITVPSLRSQREDIAGIAASIDAEFRRAEQDTAGPRTPPLRQSDLEWATGYDWPGNIRQLKDAIRLHVFEQGRRALSDLASENEPFRGRREVSVGAVAMLVEQRLDSALKGERAVPGSLSTIVDDISTDARKAVVAWFDSRNPDDEVLARVFPDGQPRSIRSKISQWRNQ